MSEENEGREDIGGRSVGGQRRWGRRHSRGEGQPTLGGRVDGCTGLKGHAEMPVSDGSTDGRYGCRVSFA